MNIRLAMVVMGVLVSGCATREPVEEGPARVMARVPKEAQASAQGYIAALDKVSATLSRVTDTPSARGAMPGLESQLAELSMRWKELQKADAKGRADARYAFSESLAGADERFDAQVSRLKGTPGVGTTLAPLLDKIQRWK